MNTKQLIMKTFLDDILENGYDNATINGLLRKLQISKGAFYHHFKSREDLYTKALNHHLLSTVNEIDANMDSMSFRDIFKGDILRLLEEGKGPAGIRNFLEQKLKNARKQEYAEVAKLDFQRKTELGAQLCRKAQRDKEIRQEVDADFFAELLYYFIFGKYMVALTTAVEPENFADDLANTIDRFFDAFADTPAG